MWGRGSVKFRSKNIPLIMMQSTSFGPIFTRSNKLVTELLVVVQTVLSECTNSAGSCVSGNVTTISSHKPFSAIGKYKRQAKRSQIPFGCAISFAFFRFVFLDKVHSWEVNNCRFCDSFLKSVMTTIAFIDEGISFAFSLAYH